MFGHIEEEKQERFFTRRTRSFKIVPKFWKPIRERTVDAHSAECLNCMGDARIGIYRGPYRGFWKTISDRITSGLRP